MPKRSKKSDSDPPSNRSNELEILEEGIEIEHTKAYGIGIDCHSKFIQVSVIIKRNLHTFEFRYEAGTDLPSLAAARDKAIDIIKSKSDPPVTIEDNSLHYCIESTSSYHLPIINVWKGVPSIVNPMLAGATKRKNRCPGCKAPCHSRPYRYLEPVSYPTIRNSAASHAER